MKGSTKVYSAWEHFWASEYHLNEKEVNLRRLRSDLLNPKFGNQKSALLWLKSHNFSKTSYFNKVKFTKTSGVVLQIQ